jgi:CDP-diglyceride synthetase
MSTEPQFDWAGVIFGIVIAAAGFGAAYWLWPAELTIGQVARLFGALALGIFGVIGALWAIKDANEPFR